MNQAVTTKKPSAPQLPSRKDAPLQPGYYTVQLFGSHVTFRIIRQDLTAKFAPGEYLLERLTGPDNTSSYRGVAFISRDFRRAHVWGKHKADTKLTQAITVLERQPGAAAVGYAMASGRCYVCGRMLTTPESIASGIGPVCAEGGGGY
jgi:hypothetical protein